MIAILAVVGFRLFPQRDVTVLRDGEALSVPASLNADEALSAVALGPADLLVVASAGGHTSYAVQRARQLRVEVDGQVLVVYTQASTVGGALAQAGLSMRPGDRVYLDGLATTVRGPLAAIPSSPAEYARYTSARGSLSAGQPPSLTVVRARPVTLHIDQEVRQLLSAAPTVQELLAENGLTVRQLEGDLVHPGLSESISEGLVVRLEQARTVTYILDGQQKQLYTRAGTVGGLLHVLELELGPDDFVSHGLDAVVTNGLQVIIGLTRVVEEDVPEPIKEGMVNVIRTGIVEPYIVAGEPGVRVVRHRITYKNGAEVAREAIDSGTVVREPVNAIRYVPASRSGPAVAVPSNDPGIPTSYRQKMTVWATWYNAAGGGKEPGDQAYGYTATGQYLQKGICAVDPTVIPLHTRFYVPGYGMCVAEDVGGAIKGFKIDLGYGDNDAVDWGSHYVEIYIVD